MAGWMSGWGGNQMKILKQALWLIIYLTANILKHTDNSPLTPSQIEAFTGNWLIDSEWMM